MINQSYLVNKEKFLLEVSEENCKRICLMIKHEGVGVFAGYFGRDDLTAQVLIDINGEKCYRTGDFGRLDVKSGELEFIGRKDFQVKLRGQRIELGQIEETVREVSPLISGCIVVKYTYHDQEHLLAYVESSSDSVKEDELRDQCLCRLPTYMVPSVFVLLERFPLTSNGKINRKGLPSPNSFTLTDAINKDNQAITSMEICVHDLWCDVLHMEQISIHRSFFALHGTSLLFMKLYNLYQIKFGIAPDVVKCLRHATISEHAELLDKIVNSPVSTRYESWGCLHVDHGEIILRENRPLSLIDFVCFS